MNGVYKTNIDCSFIQYLYKVLSIYLPFQLHMDSLVNMYMSLVARLPMANYQMTYGRGKSMTAVLNGQF